MKFHLLDYAELIENVREEGYVSSWISDMPAQKKLERKNLYLRHDIDLHITGIIGMALVESILDHQATYYIRLDGHYNPMQKDNVEILREICSLGHEIGLHYDLSTYPYDIVSAQAKLEREISILSDICEESVKTICMHNPRMGGPDIFKSSKYIHPHNPAYAPDLYVSDSCRIMFDVMQKIALDNPQTIMINTHPELWMGGNITDNAEYIRSVVIPNGSQSFSDFCKNEMLNVWMERCSR